MEGRDADCAAGAVDWIDGKLPKGEMENNGRADGMGKRAELAKGGRG